FTCVNWNDEKYRFVVSNWIEGEHIMHFTENIAEAFGKVATKIHDISSTFQSSIFQKKSYFDGYAQFIHMLESKERACRELREYINLATYHIDCAYTSALDFIVQTDLNPLNVLWDSSEQEKGIIDFESIGYDARIEGLAFVITCYSRTERIESHEVNPSVHTHFLT
ncbi:phosphotransferase, partial [Bacillus sp. S1-R5C1-FB]|uniref:phosphotransferase n=1 Tax=Bacillus sp. S1-R5C1-FB TaxID=1973491 RepID=UPI0015C504EB